MDEVRHSDCIYLNNRFVIPNSLVVMGKTKSIKEFRAQKLQDKKNYIFRICKDKRGIRGQRVMIWNVFFSTLKSSEMRGKLRACTILISPYTVWQEHLQGVCQSRFSLSLQASVFIVRKDSLCLLLKCFKLIHDSNLAVRCKRLSVIRSIYKCFYANFVSRTYHLQLGLNSNTWSWINKFFSNQDSYIGSYVS